MASPSSQELSQVSSCLDSYFGSVQCTNADSEMDTQPDVPSLSTSSLVDDLHFSSRTQSSVTTDDEEDVDMELSFVADSIESALEDRTIVSSDHFGAVCTALFEVQKKADDLLGAAASRRSNCLEEIALAAEIHSHAGKARTATNSAISHLRLGWAGIQTSAAKPKAAPKEK